MKLWPFYSWMYFNLALALWMTLSITYARLGLIDWFIFISWRIRLWGVEQ